MLLFSSQNLSYVLAQRGCYATGQPPSDFWQRPRRTASVDVAWQTPVLGVRARRMLLLSDPEVEREKETDPRMV